MRIALVGATGLVGSKVLAEAVERGHGVVAIARNASKVPVSESVTAVSADAEAGIEPGVFEGLDVVVTTFNPGWGVEDLYQRTLNGQLAIERGVVAAGVQRLFVVGGAGSLLAPDGSQLVDGPAFPDAFRPGASAVRDYLTHLRTEAPTGVTWTFLSPAVEFGNPQVAGRTGQYRVGGDTPVFDAEGRSRISAEDLAVAIVDELEQGAHPNQRFTVGY